MKRIALIALTALVLTSCGLSTYECHTYGNTNRMTKHGNKAQTRYAKGRM
jgi:PBP1b-binding outer membrane lipoprotein LpoB